MPKLALPGIWVFDGENSRYHSFKQLLLAVNHRLEEMGQGPWTAPELLSRFFIVTRDGYTKWTDGALVAWTLCALADNGVPVIFSAKEFDWYGHLECTRHRFPTIKVPKDVSLEALYFPAGWGKRVLEYLDKGVEAVIPMRVTVGMTEFVVDEQSVKMR